jgi:hypothetical protein
MDRSRLARGGVVPPDLALREKPPGSRGEGDPALGDGLDEAGLGSGDVESVVGDPVGATGLGLVPPVAAGVGDGRPSGALSAQAASRPRAARIPASHLLEDHISAGP